MNAIACVICSMLLRHSWELVVSWPQEGCVWAWGSLMYFDIRVLVQPLRALGCERPAWLRHVCMPFMRFCEVPCGCWSCALQAITSPAAVVGQVHLGTHHPRETTATGEAAALPITVDQPLPIPRPSAARPHSHPICMHRVAQAMARSHMPRATGCSSS